MKITADINNTGDTWVQVTLSGKGAPELTEEKIEAALSMDAEPVGYLHEFRATNESNWSRDFSFSPLVENGYVRNIKAIYIAPPAPSVAVKALEWEVDEPDWHVAKTCFGFGYEVRKTDRGAVRFRYGTRSFEPFEGSFEAAKDFCQADYNARIRSAIA